jgi:hypothetical protein
VVDHQLCKQVAMDDLVFMAFGKLFSGLREVRSGNEDAL